MKNFLTEKYSTLSGIFSFHFGIPDLLCYYFDPSFAYAVEKLLYHLLIVECSSNSNLGQFDYYLVYLSNLNNH